MYKLIVSIVKHNFSDLITKAANENGATGGTVTMARGTASNSVLQLLGLGDTSKDLVYILVEEKDKQNVINNIVEKTQGKKNFGILYSQNVSDFFKSSNAVFNASSNTTAFEKGEAIMENTHTLINIIVNKGYAEDAMAAARKAGAGGGTIINAHGTAKPGDSTFFGVEIVPEKEMLMIIVAKEKASAVLEAIKKLPCLNKAGSGIVFCNDVSDFTMLGNA
jgi:nitrogen regulatory protein PII